MASIATRGTRITLMALAMIVMTGCNQQARPPIETTVKEPSDMQNAVPLVHRLERTHTGPIELEFEVHAQPDDLQLPVFIGVRVSGQDPTTVSDVADRLMEGNVSALVHLYHLQESGPVAVALQRTEWISRSEAAPVTLSADGRVPGLFAMDADVAAMQRAGFVADDAAHRELAFAYTDLLPAGRYRAHVQLQDPNALHGADAALLIASVARAK